MKKHHKIIFHLFVFFLLQCLPFFTKGQTTFQKIYSDFYNMDGLDVIPAINGGYIITGMINNDIIDDIDIHIIKTNNTGGKEWGKTYGGNKPEYSFGILKAVDDSGYFIIGYSQSFGGGDYDVWLLKIDMDGDTLWSKTYGSWGNDQGKEIIPTSDGNYMIVGFSNGLGGPNYDAYLVKINPDGDIIWEKKYGGTNVEWGNSVKQTADGGYILLGQTFSYGSNGDAYLVKTDQMGTVEWSKNFGGAYNDDGIFILANNDGTYTFCVRDSSTVGADIDVRIIKTDASGDVIWNKVYGGNKKDTPKMIQPTNDGGYVVASISRSFSWSQKPDMWILKLDSDGDTLWSRSYGGQDNEHCYSVRQTSDGGYIAVGKTESYSFLNDIMFLKLNSAGKMGPVGIREIIMNDVVSIYPNPTNDKITIDLDGYGQKDVKLEIYDALGQAMYAETVDLPGGIKTIDLKGQKAGVYFLNVQSEGGIVTKKIMVD